jgi:hypothetical protein
VNSKPARPRLPPAVDQTPAQLCVRTCVLTCPNALGRHPTHRELLGRVDHVTVPAGGVTRIELHFAHPLGEHHPPDDRIPIDPFHRRAPSERLGGRPPDRPDNSAAGSYATADLAVGVLLLPEIGKRRRSGAMRARSGRESKLMTPHAPESRGTKMHEDILRLVYYSLQLRKAAEIWVIGPNQQKYRVSGQGQARQGR